MSKRFTVQIDYEATVDVRLEAETEAEAKGLAEKLCLYQSTVLVGIGSNRAETITSEQSISVLDIEEYTTPEQFQPESLEPLEPQHLSYMRHILHMELREWSASVDWQQMWGISDEEWQQIRRAVGRLQLPEVQQ
tara:strand:- start:536 stop:940 length:405 start_codon:yes stop_codon:yes gene_type:complete